MYKGLVLLLMVSTAASGLAGCLGGDDEGTASGYTLPMTIDVQGAKDLLDSGSAVLLDIREPEEHTISHLPGSIDIPLGEVESRKNELGPVDRIIVMCRSGSRSAELTPQMREWGFQRAQSMAGGINAWAAQIDPSLPTY